MKRLSVCLGMIALLAFATGAMANFTDMLELCPEEYYIDGMEGENPYQGETIEVLPGDIEMLYFHITEPGLWHVQDYSFHWEVVSGDASSAMVELLDPMVQPSIEYTGSKWYPYGVIAVHGTPSTTVAIQIDLRLQEPTGTIWSNTLYKHITPEPSALLALGIGVLGMGGLLLRRRR